MSQIKAVEEIKTRILFYVTFFFENRAIRDIMWKNIVESGRPQVALVIRYAKRLLGT